MRRTTRVYYRVELELLSALSIGGPDGRACDVDVVRDNRGKPLIPATSLAGVLRSHADEKTASCLYGNLVKKDEPLTDSIVRVFDGVWVAGNDRISERDNVSLTRRVATDGLKFDREVVERGARFVFQIEVTDASDGVPECVEAALGALDSGELTLGAKTTRGLGRVHLVAVRKAFDLKDERERMRWLDFSLFDDASWADADAVDLGGSGGSDDLVITLELEQCGPISVREYSTEPGQPDFTQLTIRDSGDSACASPIVPGTSWAGAFREAYESMAGEGLASELFGYVGKDSAGTTQTRRSRISFSETELSGGNWKDVSRNSIDRFTGGTKDGALFTLRTYHGGHGMLELRIRRNGLTWSEEVFAPFVCSIADLHNGFIGVGGLVAVGHGTLKVKGAALSCQGKDVAGFAEALLRPSELDSEMVEPDVGAVSKLMLGAYDATREEVRHG